MTTWLTVFAVWCIACGLIFAFNHGAHKDGAEDDSP